MRSKSAGRCRAELKSVPPHTSAPQFCGHGVPDCFRTLKAIWHRAAAAEEKDCTAFLTKSRIFTAAFWHCHDTTLAYLAMFP
jgi:hypothetical protein